MLAEESVEPWMAKYCDFGNEVMNLSRLSSMVTIAFVAPLCLLVAAPAAAHPGTLWGIDTDTVLMLRDEARMTAHSHDSEEAEDECDHPDDCDETSDGLDQTRTVVIDPGHGGDNSGATGIAGVPEKRLTLELAYELREHLQDAYPELRVIMTRYRDESVSLTERVEMANAVDADLFLSLHYNAAPHDRALGIETYFLDADQVTPGEQPFQAGPPVASADISVPDFRATDDESTLENQSGETLEQIRDDLLRAHRHDLSGLLAEAVQMELINGVDAVDRGVKQGRFTVLQEAAMPAVVIEAGFLTHPKEGIEVLDETHRTSLVDSLFGAVERFDEQLATKRDAIDAPDTADATTDEVDGDFDRIGSTSP